MKQHIIITYKYFFISLFQFTQSIPFVIIFPIIIYKDVHVGLRGAIGSTEQ
jgi:hypothetical protein